VTAERAPLELLRIAQRRPASVHFSTEVAFQPANVLFAPHHDFGGNL
jgi:hypothetical protein